MCLLIILQTRIKHDDVQLYTSVDDRSSRTRTQCSLKSHTSDSSRLACMRLLSSIVVYCRQLSSIVVYCRLLSSIVVYCRQQNVEQAGAALRSLASTDWGYMKSIFQSSYIATGRSTVEYAAVSWLPWISNSTMKRMEMRQRNAGRAITGQIKTTPVEEILAEADLPTVATWSTQISTIASEK